MSTNPATTPDAPPPPARSNAVWWILGIVAGGLILIVIFATTIGLYIAKSLHVRETGKKVEISTPVGQIQVSKDGTHDTGLPAYPGATEAKLGDSANVEFIPAEGERVGVAAAEYFTPDPIEKVADWYASRLGSEFTREGPGYRMHRFRRVHASDADVAFIYDKNHLVRLVSLKKRTGGVEIGLARFGKQEAQ